MMSRYGANPIFCNKKNKDLTPGTHATSPPPPSPLPHPPPPLPPTSDNISFLPKWTSHVYHLQYMYQPINRSFYLCICLSYFSEWIIVILISPTKFLSIIVSFMKSKDFPQRLEKSSDCSF